MRDHPPDRGDVDDLAAAARLHAGHDGLGGEEAALHMHGEHSVEILLGDLLERRLAADAGIVDQDVDTAESALGIARAPI